MARIDVRVDTAELGAGITRSAAKIDGVSSEVTSAGTALVAAEAEAAQAVCAQLNGGFLLLIRNQIQQRLARSSSTILARSAQLNQEERTAGAIRQQFLRDFAMIKNRYVRLFDALDRSLDQQIAQLDKPAVDLVRVEQKQNVNRRYLAIGTPIEFAGEGSQAASLILVAAIKRRVMAALERMREYFNRVWLSRDEIQTLLLARPGQRATEVCLPILHMHADDISSEAVMSVRRFPGKTEEEAATGALLRSQVPGLEERLAGQPDEGWQWMGEHATDRESVMTHVGVLAEGLLPKSEYEKRVRDTILSLARNSEWQKIGRVRA